MPASLSGNEFSLLQVVLMSLDFSFVRSINTNWLLGIDTAGIALAAVCIQSRLHYMTSNFYIRNEAVRSSCDPTIIFINRMTVYGFFFVLSLSSLLLSVLMFSEPLTLLAVFLAVAAFLVTTYQYARYLLRSTRHRLNEMQPLDNWRT